MSGVLVIIPAYKRPEYTAKCIKAFEDSEVYNDNVLFSLIDDGSSDETAEIFNNCSLPKTVLINPSNCGLRNILINSFMLAQGFEYMIKMDNDCVVPKKYVSTMVNKLETLKVDILSPNVYPSHAAYVYGQEDRSGLGYRPAKLVGGLWAMPTSMIKDMSFQPCKVDGIRGAYQLLNQIIVEKEPRIGWLPDIVVQDIGHLSGNHPEHIASEAHREYSAEVGRHVAW